VARPRGSVQSAAAVKGDKKKQPERDSHGRREEVLDVALKIFAAQGYRATTLEDIARELDFTPAALYYYFKSKQALLELIVARPIDALLEQARKVSALDEPPVEKLRAAIVGHVKLITERQEWFSVMLREQIELPPDNLVDIDRKNREYRVFLTALINDAVNDGTLKTSNSSVVTLILVGAINWTLQWWRDDGFLAPEEVAKVLISLTFDGLRPRSDAE
jgi:AcrR family transcriptional regulator